MTGQLENSAIEHLKKEIRLQVIPCHLQNNVVKEYETLDSVAYLTFLSSNVVWIHSGQKRNS